MTVLHCLGEQKPQALPSLLVDETCTRQTMVVAVAMLTLIVVVSGWVPVCGLALCTVLGTFLHYYSSTSSTYDY